MAVPRAGHPSCWRHAQGLRTAGERRVVNPTSCPRFKDGDRARTGVKASLRLRCAQALTPLVLCARETRGAAHEESPLRSFLEPTVSIETSILNPATWCSRHWPTIVPTAGLRTGSQRETADVDALGRTLGHQKVTVSVDGAVLLSASRSRRQAYEASCSVSLTRTYRRSSRGTDSGPSGKPSVVSSFGPRWHRPVAEAPQSPVRKGHGEGLLTMVAS